MISVIGLNDVVVVDTADGLLVSGIHSTDDVKKLVKGLKIDKLDKYI